MRDGWKTRWGWRVSVVVLVGGLLVLGAGTVVTQAGERDDDHNNRNPFQQILHKLDKILDAIKDEGGQDGNHTLRWDQALPAAQRFVVLAAFNNQAVLDKNTGLVWERSPGTSQIEPPWSDARFACISKNVGGQKGWRLPAIAELASLIDPSVPVPGPTLSPGHPFINVQSKGYWSATADAAFPEGAWAVGFDDGAVAPAHRSNGLFVWCVRGGMNADAY